MIKISLVAKLKTIEKTSRTEEYNINLLWSLSGVKNPCFCEHTRETNYLFNIGQFLGLPISEANTTALKNTEAALRTEKVKSSKTNVYIKMTQDQCLDNVHPAISNNRSTNDQVSDDLNNSKNSIVSNGVNNVQEFNVDVNSKRSEHSANVAIARNCAVDADSPTAGKVLTTSEHSADTSSEFGNLKKDSDILVINIDVNKSECANHILLPDMTVITHQNSSENIRDIIASSDQINKAPGASQTAVVGNIVNSRKKPVNGNSVSKSGAIKKKIFSSKSKYNVKGEPDESEDPIERLNKLRASISNALSEVKGVLQQYSTEQSIDDGENESTPSSQPADDGPVRFRFVRKIRRRSVFSEDDNGKLPQNNKNDIQIESNTENSTVVVPITKDVYTKISTDSNENESTSSTISEVRRPDEVLEIFKEKHTTSSINNQDEKIQEKDETSKKPHHPILEIPASSHVNSKKEHEQLPDVSLNRSLSISEIEEEHRNKVPPPIDDNKQSSVLKENNNTKTLKEINQIEASTNVVSNQAQLTSNADNTDFKNTSSTTLIKAKTAKPKKLVKKDRRASIAAVEVNQVLNDTLSPSVELKTQRRPSDSSTLLKQSGRIKIKIGEKTKLLSKSHVQKSPPLEADVSNVIETIVQNNQISQTCYDDIKKFNSQESKESTPNASNVPAEPRNEISSTLATEPLTKAETVKAVPVSIAENQSSHLVQASVPQTEESRIKEIKKTPIVNIEESKPSSAQTVDLPVVNKTEVIDGQAIQTPTELGTVVKRPANKAKNNESTKLPSQRHVKTSPVTKTEVPIAPAPIAKAHQIIQPGKEKVKIVSEESNKSAQTTSNLSAPIHDKIFESPEVAESVNAPSAIIVQDEPIQSVKLNVLQTDKSPKESKKETSTISTTKTNTTSVVKTGDLTVDKITTISSPVDVQLPQTPELPVVPAPIKSVQADESELAQPSAAQIVDVVQKSDLVEEESSVEIPITTDETEPEVAAAPPKKKRKAKRKVVIRRIKRKLSKDDTFIQTQEAPSELEICEKEIEEKDLDEESEEEPEIVPKQRKSCIKPRQFEIGDVVMYAERYKKTQVKWRKGVVIERITSISYKLDLGGEEKPAHISYIKKFTDRKVNFGGKEYLEIDYAQIEEDEEKERNYSIWNLV